MPTTKINLDFGWTCNLVDPSNKLSSNILAITKDINFIVNSLNTYIKFKVPLDLSISIQPESSNPLGAVNGVAAATGVNFIQDSGVLKPASLIKGQTGRDINGSDVDLGFTIWLGTDGTPRSYGRPIWFDPNPQSWNSSNLPSGSTDFISIALHELVHCLGFATSTNPASPSLWNANTILKEGNWFFTSPAIIALLGKELPLGPAASAQGGFKTSVTALDHVGNTYINDQPITSDLMYLRGSDELNRLQLGQVDLLVLQALGWDIQNYQNLPLTDPLDFTNVTVTQAKGSVTLPPNNSSIVTVTGIDSTITLFAYPTGVAPNLPGLRNGNYLINGGSGIDKVVVGDKASFYKVVLYQENKYLLQNPAGTHAVSLLNQVERLQFSDKNIALDTGTTQAAGQTALLIGAVLPGKLAFDASKQVLLGSVIGLFDQGFSLQALSGAILRLPIWDVLTNKASPTTTDIASYLVNNVYGGTQTAAITSAAIAAMNAESGVSQGNYLASLAASDANQSHINLVGVQATGLVYLG